MAFLFDQFPRSLDPFGRYRVSKTQTLFNSKQLGDNQPLLWDDAQTSGGGTSSTYNANQASNTLAVSNLTAGTRVRQTFRSFNYQPGKGQQIYMTAVLGAGAAGIRRRVGYFNQNNGIFLQLDGTTLSVVVRTFTSGAPVDTVVTQANWNLDKLDGAGPSSGNPSGINLDTSKIQLLTIDFSWLGTSQVRLGFFLNGQVVYCHAFEFSNILSLVYMSLPNLPLRYEINNDGTGPAASLVCICSTVMSEGGEPPGGTVFAISRDDTPLVTLNNNAIYPLIAIRLQATRLFTTVELVGASIICTSNAAYRWMMLINPTVVGVPFVFTPLAFSGCEIDVSRVNTTTLTGGFQFSTEYGQAATEGTTAAILPPSNVQLGSSIAGVSDILVFAVQRMSVGGAAETFYASLAWRERG
jgi:hypothetical protein